MCWGTYPKIKGAFCGVLPCLATVAAPPSLLSTCSLNLKFWAMEEFEFSVLISPEISLSKAAGSPSSALCQYHVEVASYDWILLSSKACSVVRVKDFLEKDSRGCFELTLLSGHLCPLTFFCSFLGHSSFKCKLFLGLTERLLAAFWVWVMLGSEFDFLKNLNEKGPER